MKMHASTPQLLRAARRSVLPLLATLALNVSGQIVAKNDLDELGNGPNRAWIDVNGDGRDDFCVPSGTSLMCQLSGPETVDAYIKTSLFGGRTGFVAGKFRWLDLNGDGFIDLCGTVGTAVDLGTQNTYCVAGPAFSAAIGPLQITRAGAEMLSGDNGPGPFQAGVLNNPKHDPEFADVNGDGLPDFCYLYQRTEGAAPELHCRIAQLSNGVTTYAAAAGNWILAGVATPNFDWPAGFYDANGDGAADFCRVISGSKLHCVLGDPAGFSSSRVVQTSAGVVLNVKEGAAFIDINGDGNTDFCRLDNGQGNTRIRCNLSNGRGWEFSDSLGSGRDARDRVSPALVDAGHKYARWWADVNGDGLPDFCRGKASIDPIGEGNKNITSDLLCRLNRGDFGSGGSTEIFAYSDAVKTGVNFGRGDGGRAFCDPIGVGLQTFCRTTTAYTAGETSCWEMGDTGTQVCSTPQIGSKGILAGLSNDPQARPPLLTAYTDGVGAETRIAYVHLSSPQVYTRSNTTSNPDRRAMLVVPRSPVVYETRVWDTPGGEGGLPYTGNARYMYRDLRVDHQAGSRGFRERWIFNEGSNTLDHVVFYQGLGPTVDTGSVLHDSREIGAVRCQERFAVQNGLIPQTPADSTGASPRALMLREVLKRAASATLTASPGTVASGGCKLPNAEPTSASPFVLLQSSTNTLGSTSPNNPRFRHTATAVAYGWDWDGSKRTKLPTTTTTTAMSDLGNVTSLVQSTVDTAGLEWRKTTTNAYAADDPSNWLLGRLTSSKVVAVTPTADVQIAAHGRSLGNAGADAGAMSPTNPVLTPIPPATLSVILQLLLED